MRNKVEFNNESKVDKEKIITHWSNPADETGKPSWEHIYKFYHPEIHFKDCIQEIHGYENFLKMSRRLTKRCKELSMEIKSIAENGNIYFFQWEMTMKFKIYPSSTLYGTTRLQLAEDGRIIDQRDYYDIWGDIFDNIPGFRKLYRRFMRRKFG